MESGAIAAVCTLLGIFITKIYDAAARRNKSDGDWRVFLIERLKALEETNAKHIESLDKLRQDYQERVDLIQTTCADCELKLALCSQDKARHVRRISYLEAELMRSRGAIGASQTGEGQPQTEPQAPEDNSPAAQE